MVIHKKQPKTIDEYISMFPENIQEILEKIRQIVQKAAPEASEAISYQIPTFKLNGKNLVHFAAFKKHIGFYPTPGALKAFKKELSQFKGAKGSVQFQVEKEIPYTLIEKIVNFRVMQMREKKA